ncbi:glycosyl hydrolases family 2 [Tothia fuscella]|uniref:Glycosyl hydrolases family 2 n=1 Tax=Tothia fuscella TaxID=1048955 RepID=A0A9P4NJB7_9PEZI|nr:glycosyl hydrolases family 2 [Tothia fuscella]
MHQPWLSHLPWLFLLSSITSAQSLLPPQIQNLSTSFTTPPMHTRPLFRWWWPHGLVNTTTLLSEIDTITSAGFGGAEINDVHHSTPGALLDPEDHGWGSKPWVDAVIAVLEQATSTNVDGERFRIDLAIGPAWPAAVPGLSPDGVGSAKEVVQGTVVVGVGGVFEGVVPKPFSRKGDGVEVESLLALQAWRVDSSSLPLLGATVKLDGESMIDITNLVDGKGKLRWKAPAIANGTWNIISYWTRGTGQQPEAGPHTIPTSYVIDHFSKAGTHAVSKYWDEHILNDRLKALLRSNSGSLFEDSLELEASTFWTPDLATEFRKRKGYDILTILPLLLRERRRPIFTFTNTDRSSGATNDYWSVISALTIEHHILPLQSWAKTTLNMTLRAQPYGLQTESMAAASVLDIPEGESLSFKGNIDNYRSLSSAGHFTNRNIISSESGAFANGAYSTTFAKMLRALNPAFAVGVNQHVFHGFSYTGTVPGTTAWPGFAAFSPLNGGRSPGYGENWGPGMPMWRHISDLAVYFARMQYFTRLGTPKYDVAFFTQKGYIGSGIGATWLSKDGVRRGWNYGFVSPSMLGLKGAVVKEGRLAPEGPGYGALIVDGDPFADGAKVLSQEMVGRIGELAGEGLRVVVVGGWSNVSAYGYGERSGGGSAEVASGMTGLLGLGSVRNAASKDDIEMVLKELGLRPTVEYLKPSALMYHHRVDKNMDYFTLVASSEKEGVDHDVIFPAKRPRTALFEFDPWSGGVRQVTSYNVQDDGRLRYRVRLKPLQTRLLILAPEKGSSVFIISTTAHGSGRVEHGLHIQSNKDGEFTTTLNNGTAISTIIEEIPKPIELANWQMNLTSYEPGPSPMETIFKTYTRNLTSPLIPWSLLPNLAAISGIGIYTSRFSLQPQSLPSGQTPGAILHIPSIGESGSFRLFVNGKQIPADQLEEDFDIGVSLGEGENEINIEVASTLLNRLRVSNERAFGKTRAQVYGLRGIVRVVPYVRARVG